jgi:hypothetical protein
VPFPSIETIRSIDEPERNHLQALDEAIIQALSASSAAASRKNLDQELIAKATVTLLLTATARHAVDVSKRFKISAKPLNFGSLAEQALHWAQQRLAMPH